MIIDKLNNSYIYFDMNKSIKKGLRFLLNNDFTKMKTGKHEIAGDNVFALVQNYVGKPIQEGKWEAHKEYIDIQYIAAGSEQMGYAHIDDLEISKEYDKENDYILLEGNGTMFDCPKETFVIFFPDDAHMPGIKKGFEGKVIKVVVKIKI